MTVVLFVFIILAIIFFSFVLRQKPTRPDLSVLPEHFVVVDLETTGLDPEKNEIIEIGAIRVNRDSNEHKTFNALIKPSKKIPNKIAEITGITSEMIERDGESLNDVIPQFLTFAEGLRLVYYNAPFDHAFISKAVSDIGVKIENPVSCALDMARRAWPELKSYKLCDLAKCLDTTGNHRALKDAELTISVYGTAAVRLNRVD